MKKIVLLILLTASLSSCSWFRGMSEWADNTFFAPSTPPNNSGSGYPYYYSSAVPIDANEAPATNVLTTGYPQAAPYSNPYAGQQYQAQQAPQYQVQPQQMQQQQPYGGYGVQSNSATTSVTYGGNKGVEVKAPEKPLPINNQPPLINQQAAPQYQPPQYQMPQQPQYQQPYQPPQQPYSAQPCYNQIGQPVPCSQVPMQYQYPALPK